MLLAGCWLVVGRFGLCKCFRQTRLFSKGVGGGGEEDPVASSFIFNGIIFYDCALLVPVIWL